MLTCQLCGSGMGSNEQGEYCSSVFCSDLDRMNRDVNYLVYLLILQSLSNASLRRRHIVIKFM